MQIGEIIHLNGLKAEYSRFGRDRYSKCTLPDGDYVVLDREGGYLKLAWSEGAGIASRKHRYRLDETSMAV